MDIQRPHLLLPVTADPIEYKSRLRARSKTVEPPKVDDRHSLRERIQAELASLPDKAAASAGEILDPTRIPMSVRGTTAFGVTLSLPGSSSNDVLSVVGEGESARLNVAYDPETYDKFVAAGERYVEWEGGRRPNNFRFFESAPVIGVTTIEDLWTSRFAPPGADDEASLEVWVPPAAEARLREVFELLDIPARKALSYQAMRVVQVTAGRGEFERLALSGAIAQLRPASSLSNSIIHVPSGVQEAAVQAKAQTVQPAADDAPRTCLLDTGIAATHPLIAPSLKSRLCVDGTDGDDWEGHGTKMAGLALYQDLGSEISSSDPLELDTALESVRVQSPPGVGNHLLAAERVQRAVELVEEGSDARRTYCFAMNAPDDAHDGSPATLSIAFDALSWDVSKRRLFCVAAGNLDGTIVYTDYQSLNDISGIMTPGQSWNALTVSACTHLDQTPATHQGTAAAGDLSPWSTTTVNWDRDRHPSAKPDVVFEGGNTMFDLASQAVSTHPSLCLLTTSSDPHNPLELTGQTSAATASVAAFCTRVQAAYPDFWPETVRALIVHSAEHSEAMNARAASAAGAGADRRAHLKALFERFGYGKVETGKVMENAQDALTLVNQASLRPSRINDKGAVSLGHMRMHSMPWPNQVLEQLEGVRAELRVTLSYFIEPNPGMTVKGKTNLYPSHGFNFDVKRPGETDEEAIARINEEYDRPDNDATGMSWEFAAYHRRGSLRHDRLVLTNAADLAAMDGIMVYPQHGWWAKNSELVDTVARYSLVATIRTEEQEIYSEIVQGISV